ncbi:hypothetical protein KQX54_014814 [Cotesia glomerata]|uniref:Receptor ligand binding region domain-containing protein n=1 Tax=Cotesia glomerata TaxID=32391 RepID=A0AAV7I409_COTGL|nr:hypothetical protein KQX54_014814 [Cotesia glomerata]
MKCILLVLFLGCLCLPKGFYCRTNWISKIKRHNFLGNETLHEDIFADYFPSIMSEGLQRRIFEDGRHFYLENPITHHVIRHSERLFRSIEQSPRGAVSWPIKKEAVVEGDLLLGGLMMVHEREDSITCGPVMPQGGIQALEAMLYTLDWVNNNGTVPGVKIGAHILDDCDKDTYGLEMAVDFIKAQNWVPT